MSKAETEFRNTFSDPFKQGKQYGLQVVLADVQKRQLDVLRDKENYYQPYISSLLEGDEGDEGKRKHYIKLMETCDIIYDALEDIADHILLEMER